MSFFDHEFIDPSGEVINVDGNNHWVDGQIGGALELGDPDAEQWVVIPSRKLATYSPGIRRQRSRSAGIRW